MVRQPNSLCTWLILGCLWLVACTRSEPVCAAEDPGAIYDDCNALVGSSHESITVDKEDFASGCQGTCEYTIFNLSDTPVTLSSSQMQQPLTDCLKTCINGVRKCSNDMYGVTFTLGKSECMSG